MVRWLELEPLIQKQTRRLDSIFGFSVPERLVLVEVGPRDLYDQGHLPKAIHVSLSQFEGRESVLLGRFPDRGVPLGIYGQDSTDPRPRWLAGVLQKLGYADLFVFTGGKAAWSSAGLTLEGGRVPADFGGIRLWPARAA